MATSYAFDASWRNWHCIEETKPLESGGVHVLCCCGHMFVPVKIQHERPNPTTICSACREETEPDHD